MSAFEERMIKAFEAPPMPSQYSLQDRHMTFFTGVVPSLNTFTEDQICDFQIGVLQLIQSIKRRGITIPGNNMHQSNDYLHLGQVTPQTTPTPLYSGRPHYSHNQQSTLIPFSSNASTTFFRTAQEAPQNATSQNPNVSYTLMRPSSTDT